MYILWTNRWMKSEKRKTKKYTFVWCKSYVRSIRLPPEIMKQKSNKKFKTKIVERTRCTIEWNDSRIIHLSINFMPQWHIAHLFIALRIRIQKFAMDVNCPEVFNVTIKHTLFDLDVCRCSTNWSESNCWC